MSTPAHEDDAPAVSVPDTGDTGDSGKLKMIVQLVKKCLGVKDIASMRLSLPASLLEPIPNLEYWHYLDRPDLFAAINDSEDEFERMLAAIRFSFSKDLRHIRGKVCKPYNSVLGEHFQSHWDVIPVSYPSDPTEPPIQHLFVSTAADPSPSATPMQSIPPSPHNGPSETSSMRSTKSARSGNNPSLFSNGAGSSLTPATSLAASVSNLNLGVEEDDGEMIEEDEVPETPEASRVRIAFLTEQISHHPPVSAYYASCPARNIEMLGIDQIAARVSGTTVRVGPGEFNKGIFVRITGGHGKGEQYQITHPVASVNGILRGSFYVTLSESTIITCSGGKPGEKLRTIIEFKEESWLGRAMYHIEGVIHSYTVGEKGVDEWTRVKHVPKSRAIAYLDGSWRHVVRWRRANEKSDDWSTLIDLSTLHAVPKIVRPLEEQSPRESRKLWEEVTNKLLNKEYSEATKHKQAIEQRQRDEAAERKRKGVEFVPVFFDKDISDGIPSLTDAGRKALEGEFGASAAHPLEKAESSS